MLKNKMGFVIVLLVILSINKVSAEPKYCWTGSRKTVSSIKKIPTPKGFKRIPVKAGSWADWLRNLPLKPSGTPVYLHNGTKKHNQNVHAAVIDIDTGKRDLQQCADAIIRLRAEYLYSIRRYPSIHFNFTSGDNAAFTHWAAGFRPVIKGRKVSWIKKGKKDYSYNNFKRYLQTVFIYAGSASLSKELKKRKSIKNMEIGDIFIQGGFPGHAVIVVDMAVNPGTGNKLFLLAQSYMPAQDVHILKNPNNSGLSPWYKLDFGETLQTPEWVFNKGDLSYFQ